MNTTEVTRLNRLAHGWIILESHLELSEAIAKRRAEVIRSGVKRGTGVQVRVGEHWISKHGAGITVWVVVKRVREPDRREAMREVPSREVTP